MLVEMTEMWATFLDAKGARDRSVASSPEVVGCRFVFAGPYDVTHEITTRNTRPRSMIRFNNPTTSHLKHLHQQLQTISRYKSINSSNYTTHQPPQCPAQPSNPSAHPHPAQPSTVKQPQSPNTPSQTPAAPASSVHIKLQVERRALSGLRRILPEDS